MHRQTNILSIWLNTKSPTNIFKIYSHKNIKLRRLRLGRMTKVKIYDYDDFMSSIKNGDKTESQISRSF